MSRMGRRVSAARGLRAGLALLALGSLVGCAWARGERRLVIAHPLPLATTALRDPAHNRNAFNILSNVYEALVQRGPDLSLQPALAESWYSPDARTWVFKLRHGVRRHDGRVLTAGDVVASLEKSLHDSWTAGALASVSGVVARGDEIVFSTREPTDTLPARLVYVAVSGLPEPDGATGPYRIRSWTPGGSIVLEAFADYRGGRPAIGAVEFQVVPDPRERARRLMRGEAHLIEDIAPDDMPALLAARGLKVVARPGFSTAFLGMDTARERTPYVDRPANPFRDPRVREAIDRAVDRQDLVTGPLRGYAEPVQQLALPGQIGFEPALQSQPRDETRARQLLKEAGYPDGFEVPLDSMDGLLDDVVATLAHQLAPVGIRVRPRSGDPGRFLTRIERRDTSLYLLRWIQPSQEIHESYMWLLHSPGDAFGTMNAGAYSNARLDRLLEESAHEASEEQRGALLREATAIVHAERPILPLYRENDLYAFSTDLDFTPEPYQQFGTPLCRMRWKD
jgi:peptide/nickel transport system substrate-binding protein